MGSAAALFPARGGPALRHRLIRWVCLLVVAKAGPAIAQLPTLPAAAAPADVQDSSQTRARAPLHLPVLHHRRHARRARQATADSSRLWQVQAGYDGDFHAPDLRRDESSTLSAIVTPLANLELEVDVDVWASQAAPGQRPVTGRGDTHVGTQWTAATSRAGTLAVALAYEAKLPTAGPSALGTGRMDHRVLVPISLALRRWQIDVTPGADAIGRPGGLGRGIEGAIAITASPVRWLAVHGEWSGQTVDTDRPAGHYASAGVSAQVAPAVSLDLGVRVGLSGGTPAYGLAAGVTAALGGN